MEGGVAPFSSGMAPSGSYILIVVSQPVTEDHKQIILDRLGIGLLSWDISSTGCDLSGLESALSSVVKERVIEGDVLIQHSTESLGVEVLLSPTVRTLKQCIKNLLSTSTCHKHLIHAGYSFAGSGSWIVENGTFSFQEFLEIYETEVPKQKRCTINLHCSEEGDWNQTNFAKDVFKNSADISLNPLPKVSGVPGSEYLIRCLKEALMPQTLSEMMKPSPLVGNIRFNRPTIYMFPAGQGDSALFGINGFNMLIDGGFHRKPCSWDFVRHLDRLDAVLVTRISESNVCGVSTLMRRNALNNANPQIGYVFCNVSENKVVPSKEDRKVRQDDLIISVVEEGHNFVQTLNDFKLKPHQCWRDSTIDPFVLYHKVGQGTLEMHVLSPPRDSKEMKQFLSEWNAYKETFSRVKSGLKGKESESTIPLSHATSICAILVWRPEDPKDTITRILFPGSTPQNKILEGLEKLKTLNILNQPVVTKSSLSTATKQAVSKAEKTVVNKVAIPNRNQTASPALSVSSVASRNGDINGVKKDIKKMVKDVKKEIKKEVKKEIKKDVSTKEPKKEMKADGVAKKEITARKEVEKEVKKDVKKIIKKENKDIKLSSDKKNEIKLTTKKESTTPRISEVKKASATLRKSTTPTAAARKEIAKPTATPKANDLKKSVPKPVESKVSKDVSVKKTPDVKTIAKTKPKPTSTTTTPKSTPKTKPVAVPKPGSKMTKAVAASSIVASAVAVTVAAAELNEKKEEINENEVEVVSEKEDIAAPIEIVTNEKSSEEVVSPLPPEALSPTPSESVSLTPSDTLSSAPLETVSPTPPLANEPISVDDRDVKDMDNDIPFETDSVEEPGMPETENKEIEHDIEEQLAKYHTSSNVMSTSFVDQKEFESPENAVPEPAEQEGEFVKEEYENTISAAKVTESESATEKHTIEETFEKNVLDNADITRNEENLNGEIGYTENVIAENCVHEAPVDTESDKAKDKKEEDDLFAEDIAKEKFEADVDNLKEYSSNKYSEKEFTEGTGLAFDKCSEKFEIDGQFSKKRFDEEEECYQEKVSLGIREAKEISYDREFNIEHNLAETGSNAAKEFDTGDENSDERPHVAEKYETDLQSTEVPYKNGEEENNFERQNYDELLQVNEEKIQTIDSQLAGLSMEGSFCTSSDGKEILSASETEFVPQSGFESCVKDEGDHDEESQFETVVHKDLEQNSYGVNKGFASSDISVEQEYTAENNIYQIEHSLGNGEENACESKVFQEESNINYSTTMAHEHAFDHNGRLSQILSMEASYHQDHFDYENPADIVGDSEMQETSVDEPDEIVRKESSVSITLNDEAAEEAGTDAYRRKSGTESEDDVDIGKYMAKEHVDQEKLQAQRQSDSDDEDVVKSPTPHAVVDYDGQLDGSHDANPEDATSMQPVKEILHSEKNDFDEKDRDSAEDQDVEDEEMIRHPTPPNMKYSEEMRDSIGHHIITNPNLHQNSGITEEPLYEEEDESDRSVSPVVEQPIYSSTAEATYPELVTVSGGTTPSEPQSPKSNFDNKKLASEAAVMEALSEHDVSESSVYSPSCQDGSTVFDLQASEKSNLEVQSVQEIPFDENVGKLEFEVQNSKTEMDLECNQKDIVEHKIPETSKHDEEEEKKDEKPESPSDEESSSDNENSESHSKDKSDELGDKSDAEQDDKSDVHNDDKSDHHFDEKSDFDEGEDRHDAADHLQTQYAHDMKQHSEYQADTDILTAPESEINLDHLKYESHSSCDIHQSEFQEDYHVSKEAGHTGFEFAEELNNLETKTVDYTENIIGSENVPGIPQNMPSDNNALDKETSEAVCGDFDESSRAQSKNLDNLIYEMDESASDREIVEDNEENSCILKEGSDIENSYEGNSFRQTEVHFENSQPAFDIHGTGSPYTKAESESSTVSSLNVKENAQEEGFDNEYSTSSFNQYNIVEQEAAREIPSQFETDIHITGRCEILPPVSHEVLSSPPFKEFVNDVGKPSESNSIAEASMNFEISGLQTASNGSKFSENEPHFSIQDGSDLHRNVVSNPVTDIHYGNSQTDFTSKNEYPNSKFEEFSSRDENNLVSTQDQFANIQTDFIQSYVEKEVSNSSETQYENDLESDIYNDNCNAEVTGHSELEPPGYSLNGGIETDFNLPAAALVPEQFGDSELSHTVVCEQEQNSAYILDNRFHSDSPEDKTMRTDSSPDVPYSCTELPDEFSDIKNRLLQDTGAEIFVPPPPSTDFENMNYPHSDDISASPKTNITNANTDGTFPEFPAADENSRDLNNLPNYAYTNKAYAREDEDIDGNHIYGEEATELGNQVEFDGKNLHALNTHQVASMINYSQEYQDTHHHAADANYDFRLEEWGKPMGLPTPPDGSQKVLAKKSEKPVKSKLVDANGKAPSVASKLSSPKKPKPKVSKESSSSPVYVDLAYVPQHGDPEYCDAEFFKKIRARYYVFSSVNPSKEVLNALLEAKKTWNEDLSVTIIPTYETDTLGYWVAQNQDDLAEYSIDIAPSASRCTVNLQDHQTSCSAYRLEF